MLSWLPVFHCHGNNHLLSCNSYMYFIWWSGYNIILLKLKKSFILKFWYCNRNCDYKQLLALITRTPIHCFKTIFLVSVWKTIEYLIFRTQLNLKQFLIVPWVFKKSKYQSICLNIIKVFWYMVCLWSGILCKWEETQYKSICLKFIINSLVISFISCSLEN